MKKYVKLGGVFLLIYLSFTSQLYADTPVAKPDFLAQYQAYICLIPIILLSVLLIILIKRFSPRKSDRLLREILTGSEYAISVLDEDLNLVYMNEKVRELFHTDKNVRLPKPLATIFPFSKEHEFLKTIYKLADAKISNNSLPFVFKTQFANSKNGNGNGMYLVSVRTYESKILKKSVCLFAILETEPKFTFSMNLQTALKEAEQNLEELKNVDKLKSEFLAICSHELKTPLVSIMGYLNLMSAEKLGDLSDKQRRALGISLKNVTHLDSLITSMLNYARMDAGKLDFYMTLCDINMIVLDSVDALRPIANEKNITLKFKKETIKNKINADYGLIYRVLLNLVGNAIKFSDDDSQVLISIDTSNELKYKICIQDFGKGIPASKIQEIKKPFIQVKREDNGSRKGLGLGLAICEKVLVGHGSTLEIESEEGKGTTVSFSLNVDHDGS